MLGSWEFVLFLSRRCSLEDMELITQVILSWDAKTSVALRKSLGSFRADSQSGGTLGLPKAQMIKKTSTSDHSESWAGSNGRCSAHICFLCFEGFKLNVLNNVAIAQAFELSRSLIDPRVKKTAYFFGPILWNLYFHRCLNSKELQANPLLSLRQTALCRGGWGKDFRTQFVLQ